MKKIKRLATLAISAIAMNISAQEPIGANIIFVGNSITYGACMENASTDAPPAVVKELLYGRMTMGHVEVLNLGVSGTTTVDWLPSTNTFYAQLIEKADEMAKDDCPLIFSISLGTNDSAIEGTNGAPVSKEDYGKNLYAIIDALLVRYPAASVVVNHPIWYSENTYNTARYLSEGQQRLNSYRAVIDDVVNNQFRAKDRGRVYVGDTEGWDFFRDSQTLFTLEQGNAGTFRLHPNKLGARELAKLWEKHIYDVWRLAAPEKVTLASGATLLIYKAQGSASDKAVVVCPGGGYEFLATENEGTRMAHWLSNNGHTAAVLLYHMPKGENAVPLNDAAEAIAYMRSHASELGNYQKIGIMGSSAGGHLASTAATHLSGEKGVDFQILQYPVISMKEGITHQGSRNNLLGNSPDDELVNLYSNELQVTAQTPRAFIFFSANDDLVPPQNSLLYANALIAQGVPTTIHAYPTGGHGWGSSDGFFYKDQWRSELLRWLQQF